MSAKRNLRVALVQERNQPSAEEKPGADRAPRRERGRARRQLCCCRTAQRRLLLPAPGRVRVRSAEAIPGPSTERIGALAKKHGVVIVSSLFERRAAGLYHNTAVVLERDGSIAGKYRKMHIPDDPGFNEKFYFTPGDLGFHPIDTSVGRLGVLVCWDQWYPEAARLMALAGAELLLYPTAIGWDPGDEDDEKARQRQAWLLSHRGHAVANGLPVLSCNRVGPRGFADRRARHRFLGQQPRARAAGRVHRRGLERRTGTARRRRRPGAQRDCAPHLALPARPPRGRLRRPAQALPRLNP
jgi:N-carbamoylputrescine amidase